jgi:hypothetical protein
MSILSRRSFMAGTAGAGALSIPLSAGLPQHAAAQGGKGPLLRIVGGKMEASNDVSSASWTTLTEWGVATPLREILGGTKCYSQMYGDKSFSRLSFYLSQDDRYDMVVGGKIMANNTQSSNTWVEQSSWGYTGAGTTTTVSAFHGFGWSPTYQRGYIRSDLYMAKNPSGPYPVGGRYMSNNEQSSANAVTQTFWGFSDGTENVLFAAFNWSTTYKDGYGYITVFTTG